MHPDDRAGRADVPIPPDHGTQFDGNARLDVRWQNAAAILLVLLLEQLPRRHAYDAGADAFVFELFVDLDAELHLTAGADENDLRLAFLGIGHHVGAPREPGGRRIAAAIKDRQSL